MESLPQQVVAQSNEGSEELLTEDKQDGMFEHATTENALAVLEEAIKNHGKPASIMTDRGSHLVGHDNLCICPLITTILVQ